MKIRNLSKSDFAQWHYLWQQYLVFYKHELSESQTKLTFDCLTSGDPQLHALVLEVDGNLLGFTHSSFTFSTWQENKELYLEDLFVDPSARGKGYGRELINAVADFAMQSGSTKLYWQTHKDNETAQKLYLSLATKSDFVIYEQRF